MKLHYVGRRQVTPDIASFSFRPDARLEWVAGQSIRLEIAARDYGTEERRFTISSAPYEGVVTITTRISDSEFKQCLWGLRPGDVIDGYAVMGDFTWDGADRPVFVASGIGITPFYSMIKQRLHDGGGLNARLIYGGRGELAFSEELREWADAGGLDVEFIEGMIGAEVVTSRIDADFTGEVYVSGSQRLVGEIAAAVSQHVPGARVRTDMFTGRVAE